MDLYVGNLGRDISEDDLTKLFESFGEVVKATIVRDMFNGESRGFGFVVMESEEQALKAMEELNEKELKGNLIKVNYAKHTKGRSRKKQNYNPLSFTKQD